MASDKGSNILSFVKSKKYSILLAVVLLAILALYITQLTHVGLWYDESVEYFYSKYTGKLPSNMFVNSYGGNSMYSRICFTYQPPLFNVLMHFWLLLFDSETTFRLAGVLVTMLGSLGLYKALRLFTRPWTAILGTAAYLLTKGVMFFALECGEYHLMLCMECWAIYFFCYALKAEGFKGRAKGMIGFLIFAVLAAYSQYGAILLMVPMWIILVAYFIHSRDWRVIRWTAVGTIIVILAAAIPLLHFFLIPQLEHQHTIEVSHSPIFEKNAAYALFSSLKQSFGFLLTDDTVPSILATVAGIASIIALFFKNNKQRIIFLTFAVAYLLYFALVSCAFYAHNPWDSPEARIFGNRYILYILPLLIATLVVGSDTFANAFSKWKSAAVTTGVLFTAMSLCYICYGVYLLEKGWTKSEMRNIYNKWEHQGGSKNYTLVNNYENPLFQYYYMHGKDFNLKNGKVVGEGIWSRSDGFKSKHDEMEKLGAFKHDTIYYVGPSYYVGMKHQELNDSIMKNEGYNARYLLGNRNRDGENLVLYTRQANKVQEKNKEK